MRERQWWVEFDGTDAIRQGDVIRRSPARADGVAWGLVVTADCDIVQGKAGDRLTWLAVVPALDYLRRRWAPEQLRRLRARQVRPALEAINGRLRRSNDALDPLTEGSLFRWLETHSGEAILAAVAPAVAPEPKLSGVLRALRIAAGHEGPADRLDGLRSAWKALGRDRTAQAGALRDALSSEGGFPDFFLLPDVPGGEGFGHVVLLRDIASVDAADVFTSERQARIADRPDAFHRVGRLQDGIRFAITQKLAFLFSRIGLPSDFEAACASATDLVVESAGLEEG